jgi:arsenate reductase
MAEGLFRYFGGDDFDVYSAGTEPAPQIHPLAVEVMREIGLDISGQTPKHVRTLLNQEFDYVITVCDNARKVCPVFPKETINIHWGLKDPAVAEGTKKERLAVFRETRNLLYEKIKEFLDLYQ